MSDFQQRPPAILLGGGIIALSVARSLHAAGIRVLAFDGSGSEIAWSRRAERVPTPDEKGTAGWLEALLDGRLPRGAVLLPCSDEGLELLIRNRAALAERYLLMELRDDVAAVMLDKAQTYELAARIGVPAPKVVPASTEAEIAGMELSFPCALKPRSSHDFVKHFPALKMFIAHNRAELHDAFEAVAPHRLEMLLTELIPPNPGGYQSYYSYLDEHGEPLFHFTKLKLRQYPNAFGLGTFHVTDWGPEVAALGLKFFRGAGLRGIGNIEFMRDPRDNSLKIIECNARFTLTTELVKAAGFDMPLLAYNRVVGLPLPVLRDYRRGVYAIRPVSDTLAFLEARASGTLTLGAWLRTVCRPARLLVFKWSDPLPAFVRFAPFWKRQLGRVVGKVLGTGGRVAALHAAAQIVAPHARKGGAL